MISFLEKEIGKKGFIVLKSRILGFLTLFAAFSGLSSLLVNLLLCARHHLALWAGARAMVNASSKS